MKNILWLSVVLGVSVGLLAGCSTGKFSAVSVGHSPLTTVGNQKSGTILIKTFVLARKQDPKFGKVIGSVPWAGGPGLNWYFVSSDPLGLGVQTTEFFAEALSAAGYKVIIESDSEAKKAEAVLQGEVHEFWVYGGMAGLDAKIAVVLTLRPAAGKDVLWQKEFSADQNKGVFGTYQTWGNESAKVISSALDDILNQAAREFASDEFYKKIKNQ